MLLFILFFWYYTSNWQIFSVHVPRAITEPSFLLHILDLNAVYAREAYEKIHHPLEMLHQKPAKLSKMSDPEQTDVFDVTCMYLAGP